LAGNKNFIRFQGSVSAIGCFLEKFRKSWQAARTGARLGPEGPLS